jgi:serine/threonine protein kinase
MGAVYAGTHVSLDRPVAMKLLLPAFTLDPEALGRFRREALTAARVSHPNLAEVYDYGSLPEGGAYIVMEFIDGQTLREQIKDHSQLPLEEAISIARQMAEGADAAHQAGIVHRDLKPSNIILTRPSQNSDQLLAKIVDFGIAKFIDQSGSGEMTLTASGTMVGTPRYMSPEQCLGNAVDARSDIYSLGVILYEMLAGQPPFDAPSGTAIALKQTQEPPPAIEYFRPQVTASLAHLIMQMLQKDPDLRPQTAAQVASDLLEIERYLTGFNPERITESFEQSPRVVLPQAPSFAVLGSLSTESIPRARDLSELSDPTAVDSARTEPYAKNGGEVAREITTRVVKVHRPRPASEVEYAIVPRDDSRRWLIAVAILTVLGLGTGAWLLSRPGVSTQFEAPAGTMPMATPGVNQSQRAGQSATAGTQEVQQAAAATPKPSDQEADQQALRGALSEWIEATNDGDIDRQMNFYMPKVETFYLSRNVNREVVRDEKERLLGEADLVDVRAGAPAITLGPDGQTAIMRFQKSYVIEGPENRRGEVLQELRWRRTEAGWKITSERDIRIFR